MSSSHSDIWSGIGAILSSIVSIYAWLYSIGLVPLFTFIAGACFTLYTQERLEKKRRKQEFGKRMTEHVYGPLHQELSSIQGNLRAFQLHGVATLDGIIADYRYGFVKEELRHRLEEFQRRLQHYGTLVYEARRVTEVCIDRGLKENKIDRGVVFEIWAGGQILQYPLIDLIFSDENPSDFLAEKARAYGEVTMIVRIGSASDGVYSSKHRINQICMKILEEVGKDPMVQEQRRQRERLLTECKSLIESIRKEIVLS